MRCFPVLSRRWSCSAYLAGQVPARAQSSHSNVLRPFLCALLFAVLALPTRPFLPRRARPRASGSRMRARFEKKVQPLPVLCRLCIRFLPVFSSDGLFGPYLVVPQIFLFGLLVSALPSFRRSAFPWPLKRSASFALAHANLPFLLQFAPVFPWTTASRTSTMRLTCGRRQLYAPSPVIRFNPPISPLNTDRRQRPLSLIYAQRYLLIPLRLSLPKITFVNKVPPTTVCL